MHTCTYALFTCFLTNCQFVSIGEIRKVVDSLNPQWANDTHYYPLMTNILPSPPLPSDLDIYLYPWFGRRDIMIAISMLKRQLRWQAGKRRSDIAVAFSMVRCSGSESYWLLLWRVSNKVHFSHTGIQFASVFLFFSFAHFRPCHSHLCQWFVRVRPTCYPPKYPQAKGNVSGDATASASTHDWVSETYQKGKATEKDIDTWFLPESTGWFSVEHWMILWFTRELHNNTINLVSISNTQIFGMHSLLTWPYKCQRNTIGHWNRSWGVFPTHILNAVTWHLQ